MTLRFLADQCISNQLMLALTDAGHDVLRLGGYLPVDSPDRAVITKAQELSCILLSLNGHFANIVDYPPAGFGGIIAVRLRNRPHHLPALSARLITYLSSHPDQGHYRGKLFVVEPQRIRVQG